VSLSPQARKAIDYCKSINADPFEPVLGVNSPKMWNEPAGPFITMPRWQWYIGAKTEKKDV
jgi:hypothetical protein